jgi:hypothetical protein
MPQTKKSWRILGSFKFSSLWELVSSASLLLISPVSSVRRNTLTGMILRIRKDLRPKQQDRIRRIHISRLFSLPQNHLPKSWSTCS